MINKDWDSSKLCKLMELTYFYKAEMPKLKNQTLDVSKLNIFKSLHWEAFKVVSPSKFEGRTN